MNKVIIALLLIFISCACSQEKRIEIGSYTGHYRTDIPVVMSTDEAVAGFVLSIETRLRICSFEPSVEAEFKEVEILDEGATMGVLLDVQEPYEYKTIPPGETQLANLTVEPKGDAISFKPGLNEPPLDTHIVVGTDSVHEQDGLVLVDGVYNYDNPGGHFKGDVNADERLDISDAIYLLNYLFGNGPEPR